MRTMVIILFIFLASCGKEKETIIEKIITNPDQSNTDGLNPSSPSSLEKPFEKRILKEISCPGNSERLDPLYATMDKENPLPEAGNQRNLKGRIQEQGTHYPRENKYEDIYMGLTDKKDILIVYRVYEDEEETPEYYNLTLYLCSRTGQLTNNYKRFEFSKRKMGITLTSALPTCDHGTITMKSNSSFVNVLPADGTTDPLNLSFAPPVNPACY